MVSTMSEAANSSGGSTRVILLIVGLMIAAQAAARYFGVAGSATCAGPGRGDIRLSRTVLPDTINGWTVVSFIEPQQADVPGMFGWSHSWSVRRDSLQVQVAFDQVGFMGWHELTQCYTATGWKVTRRSIHSLSSAEAGENWQYVLAHLQKPTGEEATLLYSIFNGLGAVVVPPAGDETQDGGLLGRLTGGASRLSDTGFNESARCLQCQVLLPHRGPLSEEALQKLRELHGATRDILRACWMTARSVGNVSVSVRE